MIQVDVRTAAPPALGQAIVGSFGWDWSGHCCCWLGQQHQPLADQMLVTVERGHTLWMKGALLNQANQYNQHQLGEEGGEAERGAHNGQDSAAFY